MAKEVGKLDPTVLCSWVTEHHISGAAFPYLMDSTLQSFGIASFGIRVCILQLQPSVSNTHISGAAMQQNVMVHSSLLAHCHAHLLNSAVHRTTLWPGTAVIGSVEGNHHAGRNLSRKL